MPRPFRESLPHLALAAAFLALAATAAQAAVITFQGKTASPDMYDVYTPHATKEQADAYNAEKEKRKQEAKNAGKEVRDDEMGGGTPYIDGPITVLRVLVQIGQRVVPTEWLMEYTIPRDFLIAEQGGVYRTSELAFRADLQRALTDLESWRNKLKGVVERVARGTVAPQEQAQIVREIDVLTYRVRYLEEALKLEEESGKFRRDMARMRYGFKSKDSQSIKNVTAISSPGHGHILWINPDVKPGMVFNKLTRLFQLGTLDPLIIRALVHESKIPQLRVGDKARVTFESMPGEAREAVITQINVTAEQQETQLPSHFEVQLSLPNPGLTLKVGMRGDIVVTVPDTPRN
ncbi:hypothetical protein NNJEOMEG_01509 [Fundidesulfovibrio magnetotacticus]|uniref:CusB-like beta-barrel domain-containing protein n=1 Tax=Fundidesulfovibrio magnetotacticus TaxID=2730080 RepID=A0A6V8LZM0_9BACT|nr:efflux RND transporter periplasmic adaptor subunit [Fundidesulfovibrio magnetotacticus]GFK93675.1 hypothetical protein NNJEOMEG_01509 [Fundidesulfovibrio magnetotacticus]